MADKTAIRDAEVIKKDYKSLYAIIMDLTINVDIEAFGRREFFLIRKSLFLWLHYLVAINFDI